MNQGLLISFVSLRVADCDKRLLPIRTVQDVLWTGWQTATTTSSRDLNRYVRLPGGRRVKKSPRLDTESKLARRGAKNQAPAINWYGSQGGRFTMTSSCSVIDR